MKSRVLTSIFLTLTISTTLSAMKRKFEGEKEKEKGAEIVQEEPKRPRLEENNELSILEANQRAQAQNFLDAFMHITDEQSFKDLYEEYFYLPIQVKDYIATLINTPNQAGQTLLHIAENKHQVKTLLFLGADPTIQSHLQQTPWLSMLALGNVEAAQAFLDIMQIKPSIIYDMTIFTSLHYALMNNAVSLVKKILDNDDSRNQNELEHIIDQRTDHEEGNLMIAAVLYCPDALKSLIDHGVEVNFPDSNSKTPLLYAAEHQSIEILELLLKNGAHLDDVDNDDLDALSHAVQGNNINVIRYLVLTKKFNTNYDPHDINYDSPTYSFMSPLGIALENYLAETDISRVEIIVDIIQFLIEQGASINRTYSIFETPLLIYLLNNAYDKPNKVPMISYLINVEGTNLNIISQELSQEDPEKTTQEYPLAAALFTDYDYNKADDAMTLNQHLNYPLIENLINRGAKIRKRDRDIIIKSGDERLSKAVSHALVFDEEEFNKDHEIDAAPINTSAIIFPNEEPEVHDSSQEEPKPEKITPQTFQPRDLKYQAARQFITKFLQSQTQEKDQELSATYRQLIPEMKEYLTFVVNEQNSMGLTLLHTAKTPQEVDKLIFLGANEYINSKIAQIPFTCMLCHGYIQAAEKLLELKRQEPELIFDKTGFTTLHYALIANAPSLVKKILSNNSDHDIIAETIDSVVGRFPGFTALILAALYCPDSIEDLVASGAAINQVDANNTSPFLFAATKQSEAILEKLVQLGANPHQKDSYNGDALLYATLFKNSQVIGYLIQKFGLDPNVQNQHSEQHFTCFGYAVSKASDPSYHETIRELLFNGGDPNTEQTNLNILIDNAYWFTDLIKFFIDHSANVNYSYDTRYPLNSAIFSAPGKVKDNDLLNYDLIKYLIDNGAKIGEIDKYYVHISGNQHLIHLIDPVSIF